MDLIKTIEDLRRQKEKLEPAIASLEEMRAVAAAVPEQKRLGRKSMSPKERREVSARMKRYWEDQRNQRRAWS
jgi:hypothetical protein